MAHEVEPQDEWTDEQVEAAEQMGGLLNYINGSPVEMVRYVRCTDGVYRPESDVEQAWPDAVDDSRR
jgi:hypothetical protein